MAHRGLPDLIGPAAFHVQQSIEKSLKAAIVLNGQEPPKIHDLKRLPGLVGECLAWNPSEEWLADKTTWCSDMRYGAQDITSDPDLDEVIEALASAETLRDEVRSKLV